MCRCGTVSRRRKRCKPSPRRGDSGLRKRTVCSTTQTGRLSLLSSGDDEPRVGCRVAARVERVQVFILMDRTPRALNFDGAAPDFHTVPSASLGLHSIIHSCPHPHLRPDLRPPSALSSPVAFSSPVATGVPLWALCVGHPRVARRSALNRGTHCNEHRTGANRSHKSLQITGANTC